MAEPILIYDGDCGFCTASVRVGERLGVRARIQPWQFLDLDALNVTPAQAQQAVQWIGADGRHSSGAAAVGEALRTAPGIARFLGALILLPGVRWLAERAYRVIAANRYRLPGATPACKATDAG